MTTTQLRQEIYKIIRPVLPDAMTEADFEVVLASDPQFGDFATNVAMVAARAVKRPPRELAQQLSELIQQQLEGVERVEVAGPGFVNLTMSDAAVARGAETAVSVRPEEFKGQRVVVEYSDPNPFKVLHVGHLYTSVVGDAIANLIRLAGGDVHAVNFGGDVGRHVGITMWAIVRELGGEKPEGLDKVAPDERSEWMARCYVAGTKAFEEDESAKREIMEYNKRVYELHEHNEHDSPFAKIYWTCRQWSYDAFDAFYARIGTKFEKYYPESETSPLGLAKVREQLAKGVYQESQGAVVFDGEPYGLHTRVFITSQGLPTYEAKDVGLILAKWRDYHFNRSVVITGNDITDYMKVVLKSIEQFAPEMVVRTTHITHGNVKLAGGVKMSSRRGNFLRATDVLDLVAEASRQADGEQDERVVLGAIKYAFLKQRIGADMVFVPEESVSLDGNSGPYLQYAHARACSILAKAGSVVSPKRPAQLDAGERELARKISEYPEVLSKAVAELKPHHICGYLYELAQTFNRFYERNRVIGDGRQETRLWLVESYARVLKDGLGVLGIDAPDHL